MLETTRGGTGVLETTRGGTGVLKSISDEPLETTRGGTKPPPPDEGGNQGVIRASLGRHPGVISRGSSTSGEAQAAETPRCGG